MTVDAAITSGTRSTEQPRAARTSSPRRLMDSLVCLALAVIVFRTFEVEGYMISTGSMAPSLLGFHKRVACPTCRYEFAVGVAYDDDEGALADDNLTGGYAVCPNCGQGQIDVALVPRNQGDQLLVHKNAFQFYAPRRWEVVVFRNPYKPAQAYVKRIAGLPFETIDLRDGDVYIDGAIQRKDVTSQRAVRINVYDHDFEPQNDRHWQPRWVADGDAGWQTAGRGFVLRDADRSRSRQTLAERKSGDTPAGDRAAPKSGDFGYGDPQPLSWVTYRHWIRSGGSHETSIVIPDLDRPLEDATALLPLRYDPATRRLSCAGVLHDAARDQLLAIADDPRLRDAIQQLAAESHFAPVTDDYGYNRGRNGVPPTPVRDLMLSVNVTVTAGTGRFAVEMTDGDHTWRAVFDVARGRAALLVDDASEPVLEAPLTAPLAARAALVEMSLFDRQVLLALDGRPVFPPWMIPEEAPQVAARGRRAPRQPVRFGAEGLDVRVDSLKLFRDVYYTPKGDPLPVRLGEDEYFVLGDNSPVSLDSRRWQEPAVPRRLFLGKPFVVHLPSKQARLRIGRTIRHIRVPDLTRIRYIR